MGWFSGITDIFTGKSPELTQLSKWTKGQKGMAGDFDTYMQKLLEQLSGGEDLSKPAPLEQQSLGLLQNYLSGKDPLANIAENLLQETMTGTGSQALNAPAIQQYLQDVIYGPARKTLQEQTMPGIAASYGKGGAYFSTPRAAAETKAGTDLESQLQTISSNLTWEQMQQQKQNQMQAMGYGLQYPAGKIQLGMQYGGLPRTIATQQQQQIMDAILRYLGIFSKEGVVTPGTEGILGSLIQAGGAIGAGAASACHIVNELYGLDTPKGLVLFVMVNVNWPKTFIGNMLNKLYRKFSKPISVFISKKGIVNRITRNILKRFFDFEFKKEIKNDYLYAT